MRSGDKPGARDKESTYDAASAGEGDTGVVGAVHDAGGAVVPVSAKYQGEVVAAKTFGAKANTTKKIALKLIFFPSETKDIVRNKM